MYIIEWQWDDSKNEANTKKHGISSEEALHVFTDPRAIEKEDLAHSTPKEMRLLRTGKLQTGLVVTVVYTLKGDRIRLISAQERRRERGEYEQAKKYNKR